MDLGRHALAFEESFYRRGQRDPLGPVQLIRQVLSGVGSDERLLALTIELLALTEPLDAGRALAEFREAVDLVLLDLLPAISWQQRLVVFEDLLVRIQPVLLGRLFTQGTRAAAARCRAAASLIDTILELPEKLADGPARDRLRDHWHEILPMVIATLERLPDPVAHFLFHPLRAWLCHQGLRRISLLSPRRAWRWLALLEKALIPRRLQERRRTLWAACGERGAASSTWLSDEQRSVVILCCESPHRRHQRAAALLASPTGDASEVAALAYLVSRGSPHLAVQLVTRLPAEADRDQLCLRLIRNEWVTHPVADLLEASIANRALRLEAQLHRRDLTPGTWAAALGELIVGHGLDPSDPHSWPLLRRLREQASPESAATLAAAVVEALAYGGRAVTERVFRVWLNVLVASPPGCLPEEMQARDERVRLAIRRALTLGGEETPALAPQAGASPIPPSDSQRRRLTELRRRWLRINRSQNRRSSWVSPDQVCGNLGLPLLGMSLFLFPLDGWLWQTPRPLGATLALVTVPAAGLYAALPVLAAFNLLLVGGFLAWEVRDPRTLKRRWTALRTLFSGLPLLGLAAIPGWRWLLRQRPKWVFADPPAPGTPLNAGTAAGSMLGAPPLIIFPSWIAGCARWFASPWGLITWFLANWAPLMMAAGRLAASGRTGPRSGFLLTLIAGLHLLVFAGGAAVSLTAERAILTSRAQTWFAMAPLILALVPIPLFPTIGFFLSSLLPGRREESLVRSARQAQRSSSEQAAWTRLETDLRRLWRQVPWWRRWRERPAELEGTLEKGATDRQVTQLYTWKCASVALETAGLTWVLQRLAGPTRTVLGCGLMMALLLGGTGILMTALRFLRQIGRPREYLGAEQRPAAAYLAASQLAVVAGLATGDALYRDNPYQLAGVLVAIGVTGAALHFGLFLLRSVLPVPQPSAAQSRSETLQTLLFCALGILGLGSAPGALPDRALRDALLVACATAVVVLPLLAAERLGALLRPFTARQALRRGVPAGLRATLAFLAITAVLPLGGLMVPTWILVRRRCWPHFLAQAAAHLRDTC